MRKGKLITCIICGKTRYAISNLARAKYCSRKCYDSDLINRKYAERKTVICLYCGKEVTTYKSNSRIKYCGRKCRYAAHKEYVRSKEFSLVISKAMQKCNKSGGVGYKTGILHLNRLNLDIKYRSSYEKAALEIFDNISAVTDVKPEYVLIPYVGPDGRTRTYIVDYLVELVGKFQVLVEVKADNFINKKYNIMNSDLIECKFEAAREYCKKSGLNFVVLTEDHLFNDNSVETKFLEVIPKATATTINDGEDIVLTEGKPSEASGNDLPASVKPGL